jgi:murein DD-endopeptidase MepM/ murein hydrolase activator NlpD
MMRKPLAMLFLMAMALSGCAAIDEATSDEPQHARRAGYMVAVAPGETLDGLAQRLGVSPQTLIEANHLQPPYRVQAHQALFVPPPATYRVQAGDSVEGIAATLGVDEDALAAANGLRQPYHMRVGQILRVPGGIGGEGTPEPVTAEPGFEGTAPPPRSTISAQPLAPPPVGPSAPPSYSAPSPPTSPSYAPQSYPQPNYAQPSYAPQSYPPQSYPAKTYSSPTALAPPPPRPAQTALNAPAGAPPQQIIPQMVHPEPPAAQPPPVAPHAAEAAPAAPATQTAMTSPVAGEGPHFLRPVAGPVTQGFGADGAGNTNEGINISAPAGTPVRSAAAGTVIYAGNELPAFGNLVLIRHEGGWVTAYGHLDSIGVERGAAVTQGQTIGAVGKTGSAKTPQLHFEVRQGSKPVDPAPFLSGKG